MSLKGTEKCTKCNQVVAPNDEGFGLETGEFFHVQCFKCSHCNKLIEDGKFALDSGKIYHPACRSIAAGDVCHKCAKPIENSVLTFKGKKYHSACFACSSCSAPLAGKPFNELEGKIFCGPCGTTAQLSATQLSDTQIPASSKNAAPKDEFDQDNAVKCFKCSKSINPKEPNVMLHSNKGFHSNCFSCDYCGQIFGQQKHMQFEGRFYHAKCLEILQAPKCTECHRPLLEGHIPYKGGKFHPECFVCFSCNAVLSGKTFSEDQQGRPFCSNCAESKSQERGSKVPAEPERYCSVCHKVVAEGYNLARGRTVHKACFTCGHCGVQLDPSQPLAERNDQFFHPGCFEIKFAELCAKCHQPMFDGMVPYKGQNYHEQCMTCTKCGDSLIGVKFTENENGELFCRVCSPKSKVESERVRAYNPLSGGDPSLDVTDPVGLGTHDRCPRCSQKVFVVDQVFGPRATVWHKKCLACEVCSRAVDSSAVLVGKTVYCRDHGRGRY